MYVRSSTVVGVLCPVVFRQFCHVYAPLFHGCSSRAAADARSQTSVGEDQLSGDQGLYTMWLCQTLAAIELGAVR